MKRLLLCMLGVVLLSTLKISAQETVTDEKLPTIISKRAPMPVPPPCDPDDPLPPAGPWYAPTPQNIQTKAISSTQTEISWHYQSFPEEYLMDVYAEIQLFHDNQHIKTYYSTTTTFNISHSTLKNTNKLKIRTLLRRGSKKSKWVVSLGISKDYSDISCKINSISTNTFKEGNNISINTELLNTGNANVSKIPCKIYLSKDGVTEDCILSEKKISYLENGKSEEVHFKFNFTNKNTNLTPGSYYLVLQVSYSGDKDAGNNTSRKKVTILPYTNFSLSNLTTPEKASKNETIKVAYKINNNGSILPILTINYYLSETPSITSKSQLLKTSNLSKLGTTTKSQNITIPDNVEFKRYYLIVKASSGSYSKTTYKEITIVKNENGVGDLTISVDWGNIDRVNGSKTGPTVPNIDDNKGSSVKVTVKNSGKFPMKCGDIRTYLYKGNISNNYKYDNKYIGLEGVTVDKTLKSGESTTVTLNFPINFCSNYSHNTGFYNFEIMVDNEYTIFKNTKEQYGPICYHNKETNENNNSIVQEIHLRKNNAISVVLRPNIEPRPNPNNGGIYRPIELKPYNEYDRYQYIQEDRNIEPQASFAITTSKSQEITKVTPTVFPTPCNGQFTISNLKGYTSLEIYSKAGNLQQRCQLSGFETSKDVTIKEKGMFLIILRNNSEVFRTKVQVR